jgi:hypothetical protein
VVVAPSNLNRTLGTRARNSVANGDIIVIGKNEPHLRVPHIYICLPCFVLFYGSCNGDRAQARKHHHSERGKTGQKKLHMYVYEWVCVSE